MVKLRLKEPPVLTVGEPTDVPLNDTSTDSPGLKPNPLAVTDAPGTPEVAESVRAAWGEAEGSGVVVAATAVEDATAAGVVVVVAPGPVPWARPVAGTTSRAPSTRTRMRP